MFQENSHQVYYHIPVLLEEVLEGLSLEKATSILDGTCGEGGHSSEIASRKRDDAILICVDKDKDVLEIAKKRLEKFKNVFFIHEGFENIDVISVESGIAKFDGVLLDLGMSMYHIKNKLKGFSFDSEAPLFMTYSKSDKVKYTAFDVINRFDRKTLANIIFKYGEEPFSRKIADVIVEYRKHKKIETPKELADLIKKALGKSYYKKNVHPATKTFMAIRIFVNDELGMISKFLAKIPDFMEKNGRLCIITFHSIEDRLVKKKMKEYEKSGMFRMVTKKPIIPSEEETKINPSSRSAKLRVYEKL